MNAKTKKITLITVVLLLCIIFTCCLAACGGNTEGNLDNNSNNSNNGAVSYNYGDYSYNFLNVFNTKYNMRKAGSVQEYAAGQYIVNEFESFGYNITIQPFNYTKNNTTTYSQNIIAVKNGADTSKQIIVGAHYDSVLAGYGIDDNASGVAAMLEAAKYYSDKTPSCNIIFVAFGAEETGCNGSKAYVSKMTEEEIAKTKFMVNIDSIAGGDKMYSYGGADDTSKELLAGILEFGKDMGLITQKGLNQNYAYGLTGDWSDHAAFKKVGIPFIYFEATNWDIVESDGTYTDGYVQCEDGQGGYAIMHTFRDKLDWLEENFPGRVQEHMTVFTKCIIELIK